METRIYHVSSDALEMKLDWFSVHPQQERNYIFITFETGHMEVQNEVLKYRRPRIRTLSTDLYSVRTRVSFWWRMLSW